MRKYKLKTYYHSIGVVTIIAMAGCQNPAKNTITIDPLSSRPNDQIQLMHKVDSISHDYSGFENAAKADLNIAAFNKYAEDSLKDVKDWVVVVNEINDYPSSASSFAKAMFDLNQPSYNLIMYSTIKNNIEPDPVLDSINHPQADIVYLNYTLPKEPTNEKLISQVNFIRQLEKGDTLLVSGAITHLNSQLKPDFSELIKGSGEWHLDFLVTDLRKK